MRKQTRADLVARVKHLTFVSRQKQKHIRSLERINAQLAKILTGKVNLADAGLREFDQLNREYAAKHGIGSINSQRKVEML